MMTDRPTWKHSEMSEADFRRISEWNCVREIRSMSAMRSVDTWDTWLEVRTHGSDKWKKVPRSWGGVITFVGQWSTPGLFKLTYAGERMKKTLEEIDKFEATNHRERLQYERLKKKFEGDDNEKA